MEVVLKDSEQMDGLRTELRSMTAQIEALKLQQLEIKTHGYSHITSAAISALRCLFDLANHIQRTNKQSRKSCWHGKVTKDRLKITEDNASSSTTESSIQVLLAIVERVEKTIAGVEQAVSERRNGIMEKALEVSETYSSQILLLERKIKFFGEQLQERNRTNESSIEKNQSELESLEQEIELAKAILARVPPEVLTKLGEAKKTKKIGGVASAIGSVGMGVGVFCPPIIIPAAAVIAFGWFKMADAYLDIKKAKKTIAKLEEVVERSKEIKTRISQLSEEKTQLGDSRTALSEFSSSIAEISTQSQAICKYSQAREILYVQEQIKANHWLSEIGRIKNRSSDFEYANTREEILEILGHLAVGLYELAESKE